MKRIFALILALLLLCTLVACSKDEEGGEEGETNLTVVSDEQTITIGTYNDCYEYEIINGNEIAIVGFSSDYDLHEIAIPDTIENCPVVEIANSAFYQCSQLMGVTLPATVTKVGDMAFAGCLQLTRVTFADDALVKVTQIGEYAFANCAMLTTITLPATLKTLGAGAFYKCAALTAINLPEGVTAIEDMTFMDCAKLATVTGGANGTTVGDYAFCGCAELTSIAVPAGLTSIGKYGFSGCKKLPALTLPAGVVIGENAFQ